MRTKEKKIAKPFKIIFGNFTYTLCARGVNGIAVRNVQKAVSDGQCDRTFHSGGKKNHV